MLTSIPRFHDLLDALRGHEPFLLAARALPPMRAIAFCLAFDSFFARASPPSFPSRAMSARSAFDNGCMGTNPSMKSCLTVKIFRKPLIFKWAQYIYKKALDR